MIEYIFILGRTSILGLELYLFLYTKLIINIILDRLS